MSVTASRHASLALQETKNDILHLLKLPRPSIDAQGMAEHSEAYDNEPAKITLAGILASREIEGTVVNATLELNFRTKSSMLTWLV